MSSIERRNISLVLGSGGARGLAHIGVIDALEEKGFQINEVVGCSIGSLVGGIYAKGDLETFRTWITKLSSYDVWSLLDFTWKGTGWVKGDRVLTKIRKQIPDINIEEMPILFSAVSTNLTKGEDVNIVKGSMFEAIRSSIAIPGVLTAVNRKSGIMVDGGVLNPLPIKYVRKKENMVVAVNLEAASEDIAERDNSFLSILQHSYYLMRNQITQQTLEIYHPDLVINIPRTISGIWDYDKADFLIEQGKERTLQALELKS